MKRKLTVNLAELLDAFEFVNAGGDLTESAAYICRASGKIYWSSDAVAGEVDIPDDLDDEAKYLAVPHKNDLDLGRRLVFRFVAECAPSLQASVQEIFSRAGAYRGLKDLLDRHDLLAQWYEFEEAQKLAQLKEWCANHGVVATG